MKSNFEERKANRLEAYENLAAKNEQLSKKLHKKASDMASVIPFGQPILVGHHSDKRDRNYRNKIHNTIGKAVETSDKAEYYKQRAESLINGTAISSDDPNALDKLQEKLERLQQTQELYKAINKVCKKKIADTEKVTLLMDLGLQENTAKKLLVPDRLHGIGIPSYMLTNNNGVISNTRKRIEHLNRVAAIETNEQVINGITLKISAEDNRVQIFFPSIPSEDVRKKLKSSGFRWSPSIGAWMRQISGSAVYYAKSILADC